MTLLALTEAELRICANALHTAADTYHECTAQCAEQPRIAEQFTRQRVEAVSLAQRILSVIG